MDRMFALGSVRLALQSRPMGCSPDASPAPHAQVDGGVPGPACLDARWTLGRLVPSGLPTPLLTAYPPTVPLGLPRSPPRGAPTSGHPEEVALWAFVTLRGDVSTAPGGTPCGRLHRPLTLHSELRAQGPAGGSSHPRWVGAPCSGALGMVLQAA